MLIHVVCFKYKAEIDGAARTQHRERLSGLRTLDGVVELQVGEDIVRSARSYDTGLVVRFRDRAALDAYQKNERHVPISQHGVAISDHIVAVDFEI
jgi:Stress responsive A/B Barrel Domain